MMWADLVICHSIDISLQIMNVRIWMVVSIRLSEMLWNTEVVMPPMHMMKITSSHFPVTFSGKKYYTTKLLLNHQDIIINDMIKWVSYTMAIHFHLCLQSLQTAHLKQSSTDPLSNWLSKKPPQYNKLLVGEVDTFFKWSISSHRYKISILKVSRNWKSTR